MLWPLDFYGIPVLCHSYACQDFGPDSVLDIRNFLVLKQSTVLVVQRNAVYARVHMALKTIRESTDEIQRFVSEYLRTPLGEPVKEERKKNKVELWIDQFSKQTTTLPAPLPHEKVERLEKYLDNLEEQLVHLSALLYDHRIEEAVGNASTVLQSAQFTQQ